MNWTTDAGLVDSISSWIDEAVKAPSVRCGRFGEALEHGLVGRINALRGALGFARRGNPRALDAAYSLSRRLSTMATVYELEDIRRATRQIEESCRALRAGAEFAWSDLDLAVAALSDVFTPASLPAAA